MDTPKRRKSCGKYPSIKAKVGLFALVTTALAGCAATPAQDRDSKLTSVLRNAAMNAERAVDYRRAVQHFEALHMRDKTNPDVIRDLAKNLRYAGAPQKAVSFLQKNMNLLGRRPEFVLELAKAQLAASLLIDAEETLTEASELSPNNWQMHSAWGVLYDRQGKFDKAQKSYQNALNLSPNNFAVLNNLALSQALAGDIDKGIETLRKVATGEESTSLVRQNLALLYGIKGDLKAARRLANQDLPENQVEENLSTYRNFHK